MNASFKRKSLFALAGASLLWGAAAQAEFFLSWDAQNPTPANNTLGCSTPEACAVWHERDVGNPGYVLGQTPFLYEVTTLDGVEYYHMIIGDTNVADGEQGFVQEVFIQVGTGGPFNQGNQEELIQGAERGPAVNCPGGGCPPIMEAVLTQGSSSSLGNAPQLFDRGNQANPLGPDSDFTGNASANPARVQMRQLLIDGDLTVDFVKDRFLDKPSITNTVETGDFRATFFMDSTDNTYDDMDTASVVTNTVEILDPDMPRSAAFFDVTDNAQDSVVTAGRYRYIPGSNATFGFAGGTYEYADGGSANHNPDWHSFFDHREDNPWTFPAERPTPP